MNSSTSPRETLPGCLRQHVAAAARASRPATLADLLFGDPRRGHPVALFGSGAAALERLTYADSRRAGALHTGALLGAAGLPVSPSSGRPRGAARRGRRWPPRRRRSSRSAGRRWRAPATRWPACWTPATSTARGDCCRRCADATRPSLDSAGPGPRRAGVGRGEHLRRAGGARCCGARSAGCRRLLVYRGANTLDAMIGHRSPRYARFGWAAARFDDVANYMRRPGHRPAGGGVRARGRAGHPAGR